MSATAVPLCRCCGSHVANRPRGLCWSCYNDPASREQFPSTSKFSNRSEPTEEELEQCIAEQMQCLPPWWHDERCKAHDGEF